MTGNTSVERPPLVSVIIPAFNDSRYIGRALASVLGQTHEAIDVIVVDDGSTDSTGAIAESYGERVRVLRQANAGAAVARNRGLDEARGEYIAFLDADDFWHPRKLELQLAHMRSCGQCIAVYGRTLKFAGDDSVAPWEVENFDDVIGTYVETPASSKLLFLELLRDPFVHTSTVLLPRAAAARAGRFDETLRKGQDFDYWLRLSRLGPMHVLEGPLCIYRIHGGSITYRAMPTNYHARVVEKIVGEFGPTAPDGSSLGPGELSRILALSWLDFAHQHYTAGSRALCMQSLRRSLAYDRFGASAWRLAARAVMRSLRNQAWGSS